MTAKAIIAHARASSQDVSRAKWLIISKATGRVVMYSKRRRMPALAARTVVVVPAKAL